jgi:hypothetical protein
MCRAKLRSLTLIMLSVGALAACGGGREETAEDSRPGTATPGNRTSFTSDELTSFARGLKAEIEAIRVAQQQAATATDPQARGRAMQAQWEDATAPAGAAAAGMDAARYGELRATVLDVLRTLDIQGKIDGPVSVDLARVDEATKTRLSQDPLAALSPEAAAALRAQMDQLSRLWNEYATLTAVAG